MFDLRVSVVRFLIFFFQSVFHQISRKICGPPKRREDDARGKVVVVTGANAGLGKCVAMEMAKRGAVVIMTCRDVNKGIQAQNEIQSSTGSDKITLVELNLADISSVKRCANQISSRHSKVDILINNAGIALNSPSTQLTKEGNELHFATNHLGHFLLTKLLLDRIKNSEAGRIVNVSSSGFIMANFSIKDLRMSKLGLGLGTFAPYCNSKLANVLFTKELSKRLADTRVKTFSVCPGLVNTNLANGYYANENLQHYLIKGSLGCIGLSGEDGADGILHCALAKGIEDTSGEMYRFGRLMNFDQELTSVCGMPTDSVAEKLWQKSEKLLDLKQLH
ncbi:retinol dehydrogenase 12 [Folsomia candida]|uniref:Retinol dehydrogenase 12 n=1 Tax=Folsomia candida TaxID=158441 RepID=A0A226DD95_FOLCA|nr:retinol dehydrogenase 12 [Folsomia candida]OXA42601.1 Retinol dehydrogenase 12 [Folsomia candida]